MRTTHKVLLPALLLFACASPEQNDAPTGDGNAASQADPQARDPEATGLTTRERAQRALDAGDFEAARELTTQLLLESKLEKARAALDAGNWDAAWPPIGAALQLAPRDPRPRQLRAELAAAVLPDQLAAAREELLNGDPRDAMLPLDEAVRVAPNHAEVQLLRGECALRMGLEDGNPLMFADAREAFLIAARSNEANEAWLGAARSGWLSYYATSDAGELSDALSHAKMGIGRLGAERPYEQFLSFDLDRTYAEIAFAAYSAAKAGVLPSSRSAALFEETRVALEAAIGLDPSDPWAWNQLANLFQWEGRYEEAREVLARGLAISPQDASLHESQVRVAGAIGGSSEVISTYEAFTAEHPELALGYWHLARATYEGALAVMLETSSDQSAGFLDAEAMFRQTRELDESYNDACLGYEVVCRDGLGWSLYHGGELELAADAFRSMEDLFPGGMRWEVQDKLWSGVRSMAFLVGEHKRKWDEHGLDYDASFEHLVAAADLASELFAYDPEDANAANDAGFFDRDTGVEYDRQTTKLLLDTKRSPDEAQPLLSAAVEHMERAYAAYQRAAELSPEDARIQNDAGLILTYYLQRDLDVAEAYLQNAIRIGQPKLDAGIEDKDRRDAVDEAVGDAYQNLGVLELTLRGDAAKAGPYFEKSLGYVRSDDARMKVAHHFIPLCEMVAKGEVSVELIRDAYYWKDLEPELVLKRIAAFTEVMALTAAR